MKIINWWFTVMQVNINLESIGHEQKSSDRLLTLRRRFQRDRIASDRNPLTRFRVPAAAAMSFHDLPRETLLHIGSFLPRASLNSLLQVNRSVAILLTPELYNAEFPFNLFAGPPDDDVYAGSRIHALVGAVPSVRVYQCAMRWDSDLILGYLNEIGKETLERGTDLGYTLLHHIAGEGNTRLLDLIVAKGMNIDVQNITGETPLISAIYRLDLGMIRHLMVSGADATIEDSEGISALGHAIKIGDLDVLGSLIDGIEAQGRQINPSDKSVLDILNLPVISEDDLPILGFLIDRGMDLSWENQLGYSHLDLLMLYHEDTTIRFVLDHCGNMPEASWNRLLCRCNPNILEQETVLRILQGHLAAGGNAQRAQQGDSGETALHNFVNHNCVWGVKKLIEDGADVLAIGHNGKSVLLALLLSNGNAEAQNMTQVEEEKEIARMLIQAMVLKSEGHPASADVFSVYSQCYFPNSARATALHIAVQQGKETIVKLLLEHRANVFVLDGYCRTPLGRILYEGSHEARTRPELTHRLKLFAKDYEGMCVLVATEMKMQCYNFATDFPNDIAEPTQSFFEMAEACKMENLCTFLKDEMA
ncbi:hypothetical protein VTL71DRAFT_800 [Oculimacula yallundae]|uniref:Uncharacterized protein n=1 Tax=Oculimacula yallundae TaxID=86028 RepID=A0ABR4D208_9HELO